MSFSKNQKKVHKDTIPTVKSLILFGGIIVFLISALFWVPSSVKEEFLSYHYFQNDVIVLGLLLIGGYVAGKIINLLKFPAVTGYILMGILLGPSLLNFVPLHMIEDFKFIEVLGLSLVALIIGGDLHIEKLKRLGKSITIITMVQALSTFFVVIFTLKYLLNLSTEIALILGAIAAATAPAATVAIIKEYKAKGPLTDTLIAVVAMDDAVCIILFALALAVIGVLQGGKEGGLSITHITLPLWEIGGSITLGIIMGTVLTVLLIKKIREKHEMVIVLIGAAFLFGEVAEIMGLSALLFNMTAGLTLANFYPSPLVFRSLEDIELPIFIVFFGLAGATLNLQILLKNWKLGILFVLSRALGKVFGVYIGGKISQADESVQKYLGFAMLPQAGVAIALALIIQTKHPQFSGLVTAIVLASVALNELIGPLGTKFAITAAGETHIQKKRITTAEETNLQTKYIPAED